jgi:hypothetical protein
MLSMILGAVLAAAPLELDAPRAAVWVNLVPTVVVPALVKRPSGSIGVTFGIARRFAIVADAAFFPFPHPVEMPCADGDGWMLWWSAGAAFRPFANDDGIGGFFLLPKVTFRFTDTKGTRRFGNDDDPCIRFSKYESGADFSLGLALSLGWDWVLWRHLLLGVSAGAGAAPCFNCAPMTSEPRAFRVRLDVDVGLRVGYAF